MSPIGDTPANEDHLGELAPLVREDPDTAPLRESRKSSVVASDHSSW